MITEDMITAWVISEKMCGNMKEDADGVMTDMNKCLQYGMTGLRPKEPYFYEFSLGALWERLHRFYGERWMTAYHAYVPCPVYFCSGTPSHAVMRQWKMKGLRLTGTVPLPDRK